MKSDHYYLSIIIPVYNIKSYLLRCINSVLNQKASYLFEIILVDDGSTDGSDRICDSFADGNNYLKVIHKKNGGLSSARNAGIELAQGDYIMFLDGDDWIEDNTLERIVELTQFKTDMLLIKAWHVDNSGKKSLSINTLRKRGSMISSSFSRKLQKDQKSFHAVHSCICIKHPLSRRITFFSWIIFCMKTNYGHLLLCLKQKIYM